MKMHLPCKATCILAFGLLLAEAKDKGLGNGTDPYVPIYTSCPDGLGVRNASEVSLMSPATCD